MSEVKLKPCPFCSGKPKMATCDWGYSVKEYWYYCSYCGCETQKYHSKEDAAEQWNTRKPMDDIVERLEKELKLADEEKERCSRENHLMFDGAKSYATGISNAIEIVKGGVE